jgi:hypothetical protein
MIQKIKTIEEIVKENTKDGVVDFNVISMKYSASKSRFVIDNILQYILKNKLSYTYTKEM